MSDHIRRNAHQAPDRRWVYARVPKGHVEQHRATVAAEMGRFAFDESVETAVDLATEVWNGIDPAILAKAFRRELVPQDPNDEPAKSFPERIRAEREEDMSACRKAKNGRFPAASEVAG